jgi:hypothetical protein
MTADPAVETWRTTFAAMDAASADPGVLAVAADARCLLLAVAHMPPSERAALAEELAAAEPGDVPALLRAWRVTAGLHASLGAAEPQDDPQGHPGAPGDARAYAETGHPEKSPQGPVGGLDDEDAIDSDTGGRT